MDQAPLKVLLTGGGTGGHITPLLAVAHKLKAKHPQVHITYVGERGTRFGSMLEGEKVFDDQRQIFAGKFRRYHGESWFRRLLDIKTIILNLRDLFYIGVGLIESFFLLRKVRPNVVLLKGGFVGMPVGLAAAALKIPFVTHDSDALPGLANRLVARWARYHATGMPESFYHYPKEATRYVGVLVGENYQPITSAMQREYRAELKIPADAPVLMITGGSNGAEVINRAVRKELPALKTAIPELYVIHQTGQGKEYALEGSESWLNVQPLLRDMYKYSGAADVIITRAGANTLAEFGVQGKACVVVPNPLLTGGHQLINARELAEKQAVLVLTEDTLDHQLRPELISLLTNSKRREELGQALAKLTKHHAADELADLLLSVATEKDQ